MKFKTAARWVLKYIFPGLDVWSILGLIALSLVILQYFGIK